MVNHAAKDFVLVVLMCSWLSNATLEHVMVWTVLDLFCGKARVSKLATHCGIRTRSFDIKLGKRKQGKKGRRCPLAPRNPMDINGHSGFVFPSCILCLSFIYPIYIFVCKRQWVLGYTDKSIRLPPTQPWSNCPSSRRSGCWCWHSWRADSAWCSALQG